MVYICRLTPAVASSALDRLGAAFYVSLAVVVAVGLAYGVRRRDEALLGLLVTGVACFQVVHFGEHTHQVLGLFHSRTQIAMTPWADHLARGLGALVGRDHQTGMELLHFTGDSIYMMGLVAVVFVHHMNGRDRPLARWAAGVQSVHLAEHVSLLATILVLGHPYGISTLFGVTYRVLWHFTMNTAGSALWVADGRVDVSNRRSVRRREAWLSA